MIITTNLKSEITSYIKAHKKCVFWQSFFTDEEMNILKKFKLYVEDNWNKCDMVAISLFVVGVSCRYLTIFQ